MFVHVPPLFGAKPYIEQIDVIVGLSVRPPFLDISNKGAGPEILEALNKVQQQFNFKYKAIPSNRKVQAIKENWVDIVMWDNLSWGWQGKSMQASLPLVKSKDIYIALHGENRDQGFFNDLPNKKLAFVYGYHYRVTDYEIDVDKLSARFDSSIVRNEEASIKMILTQRVDVAVVSETALNWFLIKYPNYHAKLMTSDIFDNEYSRHFIISKNAMIKISEINHYLSLADKKGLIAPIYQKYGLKKPSF